MYSSSARQQPLGGSHFSAVLVVKPSSLPQPPPPPLSCLWDFHRTLLLLRGSYITSCVFAEINFTRAEFVAEPRREK
jgi:hypothetical protein